MLIVRIVIAYVLGIILSLSAIWYLPAVLFGIAGILYIYLKRYRVHAMLLVVAALGNLMALQDGMQGDRESEHKTSDNCVNEYLSARIDTLHLSARTTAVAYGILLGDRSRLGREEKQSMREAGMSHIMAVSGLHIGIVFMVLFLVFMPLRWCGLLRLHRTLIMMSVWAYVVMIGMPVSSVRAALMITIAISSWILRRNSTSMQMLASTALIMLLADSRQLWDVGFQLSFLATMGIIIVQPLLKGKNKLTQMMVVTLSAQLFTLPVVAYYFHLIPLFGWIQGLLVIPVFPIMIYLFVVLLVFPHMIIVPDVVEWMTKWMFYVADVTGKVETWCLGGRLYVYPSSWECAFFLALILYIAYYKTIRSRNRKTAVL